MRRWDWIRRDYATRCSKCGEKFLKATISLVDVNMQQDTKDLDPNDSSNHDTIVIRSIDSPVDTMICGCWYTFKFQYIPHL